MIPGIELTETKGRVVGIGRVVKPGRPGHHGYQLLPGYGGVGVEGGRYGVFAHRDPMGGAYGHVLIRIEGVLGVYVRRDVREEAHLCLGHR